MREVGGPSSNASCSGSEIYERLPGSQGDDLDEEDLAADSPRDRDSDVYSSLDRHNGGGGENSGAQQEHLVRPSQIKKKQQGRPTRCGLLGRLNFHLMSSTV